MRPCVVFDILVLLDIFYYNYYKVGPLTSPSMELMRILAVVNQKGGSGKTTTTVNLAAALGEIGSQVLVVDLDPQASASAWLGSKHAGREFLEVFTDKGNLAALVRETGTPGVDLVPSSTWLAGVEKALASEVGGRVDPAGGDGRTVGAMGLCPSGLPSFPWSVDRIRSLRGP